MNLGYIKEQKPHVLILKLACCFTMLVVVYSILTYGQTVIHGDTATASLLVKAQFDYGDYFPDSWYYANGDIWVFSIHNFVMPFVLAMQDQSLARVLGSAAIVLTTCCLIVWHSNKAFKEDCWVIAIPLMLFFLSGEYDMILYQAAYTSQMIILISICSLFFKVQMNGIKPFLWFGFAAMMTILSMGGIRFLAEGMIPLLGAYVLITYLDIRNKETIDWITVIKRVFRNSALILIPAMAGILIFRYLKHSHNVINSAHNALVFVKSAPEIIENILLYVANFFACFGFRGHVSIFTIDGIMNMVCICMCMLVIFIVPVLQAIKFKSESKYVQFFFAFTVIHNLIIFVLAACFAGKNESRYLLTSIFLLILLSARYIYVYWISQKHFEKYIWTGLFVLAITIAAIPMFMKSSGWEASVNAREAVTEKLVERGLTKGYADFWTACGQEVYSDFEVRFGGLEIYEGTPYAHFWLIDSTVFAEEDISTFLMLTDAENQAVAPKMHEIFQEPIEYMELNGYHIYIFDYDIVVDLV